MIAIGCDHGGYELKKEIEAYLDSRGLEYRDYGCDSTDSVDYPIYARKVAHAIVKGECERGILICGTGIGISIAANKVPGIRATILIVSSSLTVESSLLAVSVLIVTVLISTAVSFAVSSCRSVLSVSVRLRFVSSEILTFLGLCVLRTEYLNQI